MPAFRLPSHLPDARTKLRWMACMTGLSKSVFRFSLLWLSFVYLPAHAAQQISLLLSEPGGIYQVAAQAMQRELSHDSEKWSVRILNVDSAPSTDGVVVAFGVRALQYALSNQNDDPLLAVLVPATTFEKMISQNTGNGRRLISALYLDQPFSRQLRLIRIAMPQARRIGILVSPETEELSTDLRKAGQLAGLDVDVRTVRNQEQLFSSLDALAGNVDALLLLPDPTVVNRDILKILFVKAYRQRLPIVSYSSGLVQAGALLGLRATPAQLGTEAGRWLREMPLDKGGRLAAPRYPKSFTVDVNQSVARSLELTISSGEVLARELNENSGR
jgi:putative ABC transport system substrate-binding protein